MVGLIGMVPTVRAVIHGLLYPPILEKYLKKLVRPPKLEFMLSVLDVAMNGHTLVSMLTALCPATLL